MINHSGIGTNIKNMIPGLIQHYSVSLLGREEIFGQYSWSKDAKIINMKSSIYSIGEQFELPVKIPYCDLFISPHYNVPIAKIRAKKRLVIINDVNHLVFTEHLQFHKKSYAKYMLNAAIKKSDKVLTISEFSKSEIMHYTKAGKKEIKVIYCGLDVDEVKHLINPARFSEVKIKYNLPDKYILYIGSLRPHKNLSLALQAFINWRKKSDKDVKLVILGLSLNEFKSDRIYSKFNNEINFVIPGYVMGSDLPLIYNKAECLIFPSFYEGFGLPPLEAMICGCPVISSNAASLPEICNDAVLYFNPHNAEELEEKIEMIIGNLTLRNELVGKGFKNSMRFTRQIFIDNLKREIDEMLLN